MPTPCVWFSPWGKTPRDLAAMHRHLVADGAVRRVRALLGAGPSRRKASASAKGG